MKARKKSDMMYQEGGKTPRSVKKEDKAVAKSVAGSRYVGTGNKAVQLDKNTKAAQEATQKLVDLDMRSIRGSLSDQEKGSMAATRDSLKKVINENVVGPDAATIYGQEKTRWEMKNPQKK